MDLNKTKNQYVSKKLCLQVRHDIVDIFSSSLSEDMTHKLYVFQAERIRESMN